MKPEISIIIPTFNNADLLHRAIQSIFNQTIKNWEAIIIDNSSTDSTKSVVDSFRDSRIRFFSINNKGIIAISRNFGIKKSRSENIAFLDSDDWWMKNKLEISLKYIDDYDFIYHDLLIRKQDSLINKQVSKSKKLNRNAFKKLLIQGNCIPNSSVIVKKNKLLQIGLIDENNNKFSWEDYDTWLNLAKIKTKFKRLPYPLGFYWVGTNNVTNMRQIKTNINNFLNIYKNSLKEYGIINEPWWCSYLIGMSYIDKEDYNKSNKYFFKSIKNTKNIYLILKSYLRILNNIIKSCVNR